MTKTDLKQRPDTTQIQDETTEEKAQLFNLPQIAGGALAAVTAAALGSRLGVAGTLVGAAVASLIAGVAGALYTRGLERTRDGVKKIVLRDSNGDTEVVTVVEREADSDDHEQTTPLPAKAPKPAPKRTWTRPLAIVGGMVATAAVTFVLAIGVITGWEFSTGTSLNGEQGTTIGQARKQPTAQKPSSSPSSTPSSSPTEQPSQTPSSTPSETPTQSPTPSESPSTTPTETRTTTRPATPGASEVGSPSVPE